MNVPEPEPTPLPRAHRDVEPVDASTLNGLFETIAADTVDHPDGLRDHLRAWPTPWRTLAAAAALFALGTTWIGLTGPRPDLGGPDTARLALTAGALAAIALGAAALTLRGLHQRPLEEVTARVGGLALALPIVIALVPGAIPGPAAGGLPLQVHLSCGISSLAAGLASATVVLAFAREDHPGPGRVLAASGAGALFGLVVSGAHCPAADTVHLLTGHALHGVVLWALLAMALRRRGPLSASR